MRRLKSANIKDANPYESCVASCAGMKDNTAQYVIRMNAIAPMVAIHWADFATHIPHKTFFSITPCDNARTGQLIIDDVSKKDFQELYDNYMVKGKKPARDIYDAIKITATVCPLCGVGHVTTLDHYLPKSRYPIHSVNPLNLVPACVSCQDGKKATIFQNKHQQPLYPYSEADHFYDTDWIFCEISVNGGTLEFEFYADPPSDWPPGDRERAISHFEAFNLGGTYSFDASLSEVEISRTIKRFIRNGAGHGSQEVIEHYLDQASSHPFNSRRRATALAIISNDRIRNGRF